VFTVVLVVFVVGLEEIMLIEWLEFDLWVGG
jgi:hypothetical protein